MNPKEITLFPTTHEQSLPTFHVREDMRPQFVGFLEAHGFKIVGPPASVGATDTKVRITAVQVESGTPLPELNAMMDEFLAQIHH